MSPQTTIPPEGAVFQPVAALFLDKRTGSYLFTGDADDKELIAATEIGMPDLTTVEALRQHWTGDITLVNWAEESEASVPASSAAIATEPKLEPKKQPKAKQQAPVIAMQPDVFGGLHVIRANKKQDPEDRRREARLKWLKDRPGNDITIIKFSSGLVSDGMELPVEYVVEGTNKKGGRSFTIRLRTRYDECIWAAGGAWAYLASNWRYMQPEVDKRILVGADVDLIYKVVSANPEAPQAEIVLGPTWDGWKPSLL